MKKFTTLLAALAVLYGCATVAVTGRKQLDLVSNEELIPMAASQYQEVLKKGPISKDAKQTETIKRVGSRIKGAVEQYMANAGKSGELSLFSWEFNLIEDPKTANAWCMPGGKVAFYTGILPICQDETGIAIVMGHEVAHAIANHGRERMSQQMAAEMGLNVLSVAMGQNPTQSSQLLMQAVGAGTSIGMLSFSREHESEADHMGLIFMAMAGYDPNQAPVFWQRMSTMSGGQQPPEFLSTHPSHETRIKDLQGWIPEAMVYYKK